MSVLSKNLQAVADSATIAISQKARIMMSEGRDVIILSQGESDFETPDHVKNSAIEAIKSGLTRYTNVDGTVAFKEAIKAKFLRDQNINYELDEINVSPGGKAVIYNALRATLNPGDEVIIPAPCWVSYPEMVRLNGASPVIIQCDMDNFYKLTPDQLSHAITPQTKWLILNSPSNPTGSQFSETELEALAEVLRSHEHVLVICDDIYEKLSYKETFHTLAQVAPDLKSRILSMNGVSKAYAMTGWRIGYAGGPSWLISAMRKVMSQSTSNPNSIAMKAAETALSHDQDFLEEWRSTFKYRRDLTHSMINKIDGLNCLLPDGAFYLYVDCHELIGRKTPSGVTLSNDKLFCEILLEDTGVALVPASAFHGQDGFRLSFALDENSLKEAISRMGEFCKNLVQV